MNILNGIMFPSLPISILYGTTIMALLDDAFSFPIIVGWL